MSTIVLLHGALGDQTDFDRFLDVFSDFNIVTFDFSGHGTRSEEGAFTIDSLVEDALRKIKGLGLHSIHIFGYSMGGYVGLKMAAKQELEIRSITVLGTKLNWTATFLEQQLTMLQPDKMAAKVPHFVEELKTRHGSRWKDVVRHSGQMMEDLLHRAYIKEGDIEKINTPVFILRGEKEHMVSQAESEAFAAALKNGCYIELKGVNHFIASVKGDDLHIYKEKLTTLANH